MAFGVQDFQELLHLLEQHPDWQAQLRQHILTDDLLEVPALLRQMATAQARTDEHLTSVTARLDTLTARVDALVARVDTLAVRVDANTGILLEWRYESRAPAYFGRLVRRIRVLSRSALVDLLDDAVDQGIIVEAERQDALLADLVLTGIRREDRAEVYVVVEVSAGIGADDIRRAADRAAVLAKLGRPAIPAVAGQRIDPDPAELARSRGIWQVLDGQISQP